MALEQVIVLAGLALVDSTSFGTLVIPLLLIVAARRVSWPAMLVYLGTVLIFYFAVGVLLSLGLGAAFEWLGDLVNSRTGAVIQLVVGVALFAGSWPLERRARQSEGRGERLRGVAQQPRAMIPLALTATLVEVATMVPYLAAIGIVTTADISFPLAMGLLLGYCLVMILPALVLLGVASLFGDAVWSLLERFGAWLDRQTASAVGWIVGAIGALMALDAFSRLTN